MKRNAIMCIFLLTISARISLFSIYSHESETFIQSVIEQDTLKESQNLYNGKVWTNRYRKINEDQFLFTNYFLPGTVSTNSKTFRNLLIKYDIYSDEILIPVNNDEILQLNKEIIDSFSIIFENKVYKFMKIQVDTLNEIKDYKGYFCVLYKQVSALYIKYKKDILPSIKDKNDVEFVQTHKIYFVKDKIVHPIKTKNDLFNTLNADKEQIKNYLRNNKLKVSNKNPESFIPVIRYYDNISQ